jgi:hypothetical protein
MMARMARARRALRLSRRLYEIVRARAHEINLDTHEIRSGSKAERVFLRSSDFVVSEDVLWKELLVFFMNTTADSALLVFLRSIDPLKFDEGRAHEYLDCFRSHEAKGDVLDELEVLYEDLDDAGERLKSMDLIGNPDVFFDDEDVGEDEGFDAI